MLDYLVGNGWLRRNLEMRPEQVSVTVSGYSHIAETKIKSDPSQAFVAMWFGTEMDEPFVRGFQPAIEDAGYSAMRIDRKEHVNKIDDEIIAEIRRSRFLVADFPQG